MQQIFAYSQRQLLNPIPDDPSYIHARKQKAFVSEQWISENLSATDSSSKVVPISESEFIDLER